MLLKPTRCRDCPCFKAWRDANGGVCQASSPLRGLYAEHETMNPPHWCPARDGIAIVVLTPLPKQGN